MATSKLDQKVRCRVIIEVGHIYFNDEKLGSVTLVTQSNIERSNFLYLLYLIGEFFKRKEVMLAILGIMACVVIYLIILILIAPKKRR